MIRYDDLLLNLFHLIENERSMSSIYHLLKGKKSSQTIQDAYLFQMENSYGILKNLSKQHFTEAVQRLADKQLITIEKEQIYLTDQGRRRVLQLDQSMFVLLKGHIYHKFDHLFKDTLLLLFQTVSMLIQKQNRFIPIVDQPYVQTKVKKILLAYRKNVKQLADQLFEELYRTLSVVPDQSATLFMQQFSGYQRIGKSMQQLADHTGWMKEDIHLHTFVVVHQMMSVIEQKREDFPLLSNLIEKHSSRLTASAQRTQELFHAGKAFDEIVEIRNLKESTIQDHFIEMATYHIDFPIHHFLPDDKLKRVLEVIQHAETKKLKPIKELVGEDISYFQIRLAIAVINQRKKVSV